MREGNSPSSDEHRRWTGAPPAPPDTPDLHFLPRAREGPGARSGPVPTASEKKFRMPCIRGPGPHSSISVGPLQDHERRPARLGACRSAAEPKGRYGTGLQQARCTGRRFRYTGPATPGAAPQGVRHPAWPSCVGGGTNRWGRGPDCDPPGWRGSGGAVGARRGGGPRVGAGAGRRGCRSAVRRARRGAVARAGLDRLGLDRAARAQLPPVARAASATMSATTGAALVRATSLAL